MGQVKTDVKSNEITAIPKLLEVFCIDNTVITIDAMGCQEKIASAILSKIALNLLKNDNSVKIGVKGKNT